MLGFINYWLLQWLCIRLTKHSIMGITVKYSLQYWVYPLSGWGVKPYKYFGSGPYYFNVWVL